MADAENLYSRYRILLYLGVIGVVVLLVAEAVYRYADTPGLTVLNIGVSAILTGALVLLYFKQTRILDSQRNLLTQEMNREARLKHTETLRDRVQLWHGNPEPSMPENPMDLSGENLPVVKGATIESAPRGERHLWGDERFRVIPHFLENDRYLADLLKNHAPDLQETTEEIHDLQSRFVSLREDFPEKFDAEPTVESDQYRIEPTDSFYQWMFELLVMYERGRIESNERGQIDSIEELQDRALSEFDRGDARFFDNADRIWVRAEITPRRTSAVFQAVPVSGPSDSLTSMEDEVREDAKEVLTQMLDQLKDDLPYPSTREAATVLNAAQEAVQRLRQLLIEYDGRPIYTGECKYLEEAQIHETT